MVMAVQDIYKLRRETQNTESSKQNIRTEDLGNGLKIAELRVSTEKAVRQSLTAVFTALNLEKEACPDKSSISKALVQLLNTDHVKATVKELDELSTRLANLAAIILINDQGLPIDRTLTDSQMATKTLRQIYKNSDKKIGTEAKPLIDNLLSAKSFAGQLKAQVDMTKLMADGLVRTSISYITPQSMDSIRSDKGLDPQVCDLIVIGGGASGLATAYHANKLGVDTVLFDGGYVAHQFSDAGAPNVHEMRTNETQSSLVRDRIAARDAVHEAGMQHMTSRHKIPELAEAARHEKELAHKTVIGSLYASDVDRKDPDYPTTRGSLYAYINQLKMLSEEQGVLISEETPVMSASYDSKSKLFTVKTDLGHEMQCRKLVVAQGLVGEELQNARGIEELKLLAEQHPDRFIYLEGQQALQTHAEDLANLLKNPDHTKNLFIADGLLGQAEIIDHIMSVPANTRFAVVGSGESAAKAVIELLRRRPDCKVSMFCKHKVEPYQIQFPLITKTDEPFERAIFDPKFAELTLDLLHNYFGTPITSRTTLELFDAVAGGSLKIYELGQSFGKDSVKITPSGTSLKLEANGDNISLNKALNDQDRIWKSVGLIKKDDDYLSTNDLGTITGPVIMATGYDRNKANSSHVADHMIEARDPLAINETNMLSTQSNENLFILGSSHLRSAHDGNLTGIGTRSFYTAQHIAEDLQGVEDKTASTLIDHFKHGSRSQVFHHPDDPFVLQIENLHSRAVANALRASIQINESGASTAEPGLSDDTPPAIKLFLQRRFDIVNRIEGALVEKTYPEGKDISLFSKN